jgi:hypothetical protein
MFNAASFCRQAAAWVPDRFCNFYLARNIKIAKNSTTTKVGDKISADLESSEFYKFLNACLTKFNNNQILVDIISHIILPITKLFTV